MGSCSYCLKADFINKKAAKKALPKLTKFINLMATCYETDDYTRHPITQRYVEFIGGPDNLSYNKDLGQTDSKPFLVGHEIHYTDSDVGHLTTWYAFAAFVMEEFGAIKVNWGSEDDGYSLDTLQLYDYKGIIKAILRNKSIIPLLMGVHDDLDILLERHLKGE